MTQQSSSRRVYIHVGVPKTGTTFVQASLARNREALAAAGVLLVGNRDSTFRAALDVRGNHKAWGRKRKEVEGTWGQLCRQARDHDGVSVLSHELLAAASARQIVAAFTMLKGLDVHVVVTARDPARQCVAEWQEGIKHGRTLTFEQFRRDVLDDRADTEQAFRYRACQDLPDVLRRWATVVPAANVHVVCCPGPSADRVVLWRRFSEAVGVDPVEFPAAGRDSLNSSLGVDQIDFLRRVNIALDRRLRQPEYGRVVKQYYAQELLAAHSSATPTVPHDMYDALTGTGKNWVRHVEESGYAVHGVLADLVPSPLVDAVTHPHHLDPEVEELTAHGLSLERRRKKLKKQLKRVTKVPSGQ